MAKKLLSTGIFLIFRNMLYNLIQIHSFLIMIIISIAA